MNQNRKYGQNGLTRTECRGAGYKAWGNWWWTWIRTQKNKNKNLKNEKEEENSEGQNLIMSRLKVAVRHKPREKQY